VLAGKVPAGARAGAPLSQSCRASGFPRGKPISLDFSSLAGEYAVSPGTPASQPRLIQPPVIKPPAGRYREARRSGTDAQAIV